jgi:hypothetical protein
VGEVEGEVAALRPKLASSRPRDRGRGLRLGRQGQGYRGRQGRGRHGDLRGGLSDLVVGVLVRGRAGWGIRPKIWEPVEEGGAGG